MEQAIPIASSFKEKLLGLLAASPFPVRQHILGTAYLMVGRRRSSILPMLIKSIIDLPRLKRPLVPDPANAMANPDGFCGLTGPIDVAELLQGYSRGMFVLNHIGPLKWWAPRHRMVLFFENARLEKTVRRLLRNQRFTVTFDKAFDEVVEGCAKPRPGGTPLTWITPRIKTLFGKAHKLGHAHSVEVWENGNLVGGAFGLAIGKVFFTESQFHTVRDASKVGFAVLNRHLQAWGFALNDGKHVTRYLADGGMLPITRNEFQKLTEQYSIETAKAGAWQIDQALLDDSWEPIKNNNCCASAALPNGSDCKFSVDELLTSHRSPTW